MIKGFEILQLMARYFYSYMKRRYMQRVFFLLFVLAILTMPGCTVVTSIFKAGMWWAFFLVFLVVILVIWAVIKMRSRK